MTRSNVRAKLLLMFALLVVALLIGIYIQTVNANSTPQNTVIAMVNGDGVVGAELALFARDHRASVIDEYMREYGVEVDQHFWSREYNGQTPLDNLRFKALEDAVRMKVELQVAREYGIVDDVSYSSLLATMEQENRRREEALSNREPIFGPARFEEHTFVDFYRNKIANLLKDTLANSRFHVTEEELERYYATVIHDLFPVEDRITYDMIVIHYQKQDTDVDQLRELASIEAESIKRRLQEHEDVDHAILDYTDYTPPSPFISVEVHEGLVLDETTASRLYKSQHGLYQALYESATETMEPIVIEDISAGSFNVVRVNEREAGEPRSFAETKDHIRKLYIDSAYEEYIQSLVDTAAIEILPDFYRQTLGVDR